MKYTIRELRALKKLTQKELSNKADIHEMTIVVYENDINRLKKMKYENLEKIAKAFGVEVEDIDMDRI